MEGETQPPCDLYKYRHLHLNNYSIRSYYQQIIYARVGLTQLYIACLSCLLNVEVANYLYKREWNGDLHQPSGIRYVSRSFSVRCLVSLAYQKGFIFAVTLSIVVPQSIGSFLHNALLFIHEFKITNHNYRSTILLSYPLKSSTNPLFSQLIPQNSPTNIG